MPMMQALVGELNRQFGPDQIDKLAKKINTFSPGQSLDPGLVAKPGTALHRALKAYLGKMPPSIHETIRAVIHQALSTKPPTQVTFAWAPGYDFELSLWQAPDTKLTRGGVTVLLKSRYPDDKHPLAAKPKA